MNITGLNILLTFECNSQCKHCSYQAGPQRQGHILPDVSAQWLEELCRMHPLHSLTIHGGEPFLYYNEMLTLLKQAAKLGIG